MNFSGALEAGRGAQRFRLPDDVFDVSGDCECNVAGVGPGRLTARAQEWLELAHLAEAKRLPITQGQYTGSVYEAVESRTQSDAIAEENVDIADCDEVRPDRAFASQDSQTQADPFANEILEIADGPRA